MEIVVNGQSTSVQSSTLSELLDELKLSEKKIAIELNRTIVSRAHYSVTKLAPGDELEVVQFVGGG